jgi:hypothetical protein
LPREERVSKSILDRGYRGGKSLEARENRMLQGIKVRCKAAKARLEEGLIHHNKEFVLNFQSLLLRRGLSFRKMIPAAM